MNKNFYITGEKGFIQTNEHYYKLKFKMEGAGFMYLNIPEIMTFNECKNILKIGKNTLLDLIHNGELDAFRVGNRWKITRESVEEFIRHR